MFLIKILINIFSRLPFKIIYGLSGILFIFLYHFPGYRKKIVLNNLDRAFPEKEKKEINALARQFYRYFSDLVMETIKGPGLSEKEWRKRFIYRNPGLINRYFSKGQSVLLLGSHYGNWEWGSFSIPLFTKHQVVGIYKPIKNKGVEKYFNQLRQQWGLQLVSMANTGRAIVKYKDQPTLFVLIADQTPVDIKNAHWLQFLHQDTPFLHGPDKLARRTGYPVIYAKIIRVKRGYYEVWFEELCPTPLLTKEGEITRLYAQALEKTIASDPKYWLWSHRRWKRTRRNTDNSGE